MRWLLLLLVAWDLHTRLCAPSPGACTPAPSAASAASPGPFVRRDGHIYAVVRVEDVYVEQCTNLGGVHWTFSVDGAEDVLHGGGHGLHSLSTELPDWHCGDIGNCYDQALSGPRYFVAEVALGTSQAVYDPCARSRDLPRSTGKVIALGHADNLADARARLAQLARTGGPIADPIRIAPL